MKKRWWLILAMATGLAGHDVVLAELYQYEGTVTLCTGTCDSFASLDLGSVVFVVSDINTVPNGSWGDVDIGAVEAEVFNPSLPPSGPVGDPVNDNPLLLSTSLGIIASNGSLGTTNGANQLDSGQILLEFLVPPFSSNGAFFVLDVASGVGQICLFYATAGCIPGATEAAIIEGEFLLADIDGDGVVDESDNCLLIANPDQRDTNGDGIGNVCDADLNNDCITNVIDFGLFRSVFFTFGATDADFNGDEMVNAIDLGVLKSQFFTPPGPSGISNICDN